MGKITRVNKSRKEYKCSKCGQVIPVGSEYLRGDLNFSKPIIRCTKCGLRSWEVTTSDYVRSVGEIVEDWQDTYGADEDGCQAIIDELNRIKDDLEERLDNMPEGLRDGDSGQTLQERIDGLEDAINSLENIEWDNDDEEFDGEGAIDDALSCIEY